MIFVTGLPPHPDVTWPVTGRSLLQHLTGLLAVILGVSGCAGGGGPPGVSPRPDPHPIVLLISIDGFRADYLDRPAASGLRALAAEGVRARRLHPVFPTKTFPNHYTLVTGLYPEHHGIVANTMEDPALGRFTLGDSLAVWNPGWWGGEPIWVTAERQGVRTATYFWPGSETRIGGVLPTRTTRYDGSVPHDQRIRRVLEWLALPEGERPRFVTMYFSVVDDAGHRFGPEAPQVDSAIARVDSAVTALVRGAGALGLADRLHVLVVSDHGMTPLAPERQIALDDYVPLDWVRVVDWAPVTALVPLDGREEDVYRRLRGAHPNMQVFRKHEVPARWQFQDHPRITPLILVADDGWTITTRERAASRPATGGNHGYAPEVPNMGGLFVAHGAAFRRGVTVGRVRSIDVYELLARLLGVSPAPNDGSPDSVRVVLR